MAVHAENPLRRPRIAEVLNSPLAVPTFEAVGAEGLVTGEDGQIFDFVSTGAAAVRAVIAN